MVLKLKNERILKRLILGGPPKTIKTITAIKDVNLLKVLATILFREICAK